jgi:hypothetical protein
MVITKLTIYRQLNQHFLFHLEAIMVQEINQDMFIAADLKINTEIYSELSQFLGLGHLVIQYL